MTIPVLSFKPATSNEESEAHLVANAIKEALENQTITMLKSLLSETMLKSSQERQYHTELIYKFEKEGRFDEDAAQRFAGLVIRHMHQLNEERSVQQQALLQSTVLALGSLKNVQNFESYKAVVQAIEKTLVTALAGMHSK